MSDLPSPDAEQPKKQVIEAVPPLSGESLRSQFGDRGQSFGSAELLKLTDALKFAAKIYEPRHLNAPVGNSPVSTPLMPHAVEAACDLVARGAPIHIVVAGLLHDSTKGFVRGSIQDLEATIDRKFGPIAPGGKMSSFVHLVPPPAMDDRVGWLQRKDTVVTALLGEVDPASLRGTPYSAEERHFISRAAWASHQLFEGARPRPWGPDEQLSMFRHSAEVGLLLLGANQSSAVVAAGFMHDFYEGYVAHAPNATIERFVKERFSGGVHELIRAVTEPPKSPNHRNWWDRKIAVLKSLENWDEGPNAIVCASKISTMAEGNKFLFEGGSLKGWTAGSWRDNLTVFEMLRDLFVAKEVPPQLIARYDIELDRWRSHENKTDIH